jgi:hypothetical protein
MKGSSGLKVEIRVKGQIDQDWADWLGGLAIAYSNDGNTTLTGFLPDQAALYGLLSQLSSLGLQLISVSSEIVNNAGRRKEGKI